LAVGILSVKSFYILVLDSYLVNVFLPSPYYYVMYFWDFETSFCS